LKARNDLSILFPPADPSRQGREATGGISLGGVAYTGRVNLIYHRQTVLELKHFLVRIQTAIFFKFLKPVLKPYSTVKHKIKFQ
jgi:hypothetical protein